MSTRTDLPADVWDRHANPLSGWTRLAATPVLVYALFTRRWRLLAATIGFLVVNPVLFPAPEEPRSGEFMHDVVRAEEWWVSADRPMFGTGYPEVLNIATTIGAGVALWSAWRRNALGAVVGTITLMAGKLWFVGALVRAYREANGR